MYSYRRLYGAHENGLVNVGDVVTIVGQDNIRFVAMPDNLNRKQKKQWDAAIKKAEKLQSTTVSI